MKELYIKPETEVVKFDCEDIITTSEYEAPENTMTYYDI